jgi:arylsulfatase A-like enzyme
LAAQGARFTRAFSTAFYTLPAHASLLTGLYPSAHLATSETGHLPSGPTTLAEQLRAAGYRTAAFVSNPWLTRDLGFERGFETYVEAWRPDARNPKRRLEDRGGVELAGSWITERVASNEPFFAFINLNQAHLPYYPDAGVLARLSPNPRPMDRVLRLRGVAGMWLSVAGRQEFDSLDYEILNELYEAEVAMLDVLVEQLVQGLAVNGVLDETLIVITSDHGENIGDHGKIDHMLSMYDSTIRVPLVLRYPPRIPAGTVDAELASLVDIYPTVLDVCGLLPSDGVGQGDSLLPPHRRPPKFVIAENERPLNGIELLAGAFPDFDTSAIDHRMRMLRTPRYKLIWHDGASSELYDLENDPLEERDISDREPEILAGLEALLLEQMNTYQDGRAPEAAGVPDADTLRELRALGYIE